MPVVHAAGGAGESPAVAPAAASTATAIVAGTGFVDGERSAVDFPTIEFFDGLARGVVVFHFDKAEAA